MIKKELFLYKRFLLGAVFAFLFFHLIYKKKAFFRLPELKGSFTYSEAPVLQLTDWFSGEFQVQQGNFLNHSFGLRSLYVRLNNQIDFSLFDKISAKSVVVGKQNYLFDESYIKAYYGQDFMGLDSIKILSNRLKFVSEGLEKLGKKLLVVLAPNKTSFYKEFLPEKYYWHSDSTNSNYFSQEVNARKLNFIDFHSWFLKRKNTSKFPLFPQYGIHWSNYGAVLAADSMIKRIEFLTQADLPDLIYYNIAFKQPIYDDYDMADAMNLLRRFKSFEMAYPKIRTENEKGKVKPRVLVISDSFYWQMFNFGISKSFKNSHFWYYNKQIFSDSDKKELLVNSVNFENEIARHDVFVIMATEVNLPKYGWGFIETLESLITNKKVFDRVGINSKNFEIEKLKQKIVSDQVWMMDVVRKAKEKKISVDSMITLDALWIMEHPN